MVDLDATSRGEYAEYVKGAKTPPGLEPDIDLTDMYVHFGAYAAGNGESERDLIQIVFYRSWIHPNLSEPFVSLANSGWI